MDDLLALYAKIGYEAWRESLDQVIKAKEPRFILINHGWKRADPLPRADYYLDCRPIPNPVFSPLTGTGDDAAVIAWVKHRSKEFITAFITIIESGLTQIPTRRTGQEPYAKPVIICTVCAHGIHRSRAMKHILAEELRKRKWDAKVEGGVVV